MTYPLSQTQMGIYVTCMNTQEEGNYNIDMLYALDEDVDIERLAKALDKVIEAHPYVKSRLVTNDEGEVVFEDHSSDEFHTSIFEVKDIEDVRSHLGEDYDLMNDQLFRLEIYKTKKGNYLYVDFHQIVFDGMSFVNFTGEVSRAYAGEAPLGEEIDGFEIAQAEIALRQSPEYQTAKEWFQSEYAEAAEVESTPIPDVYEAGTELFEDIIVPLNIDKQQIGTLCQKLDMRESTLLTAAFGVMLSKYTADDKVLFNTIYHGRTDRRTRKSFCMMVQTLPVFLDISKSTTVDELLGRLQTQISTARNNGGYSYGEMCADLGLKSEVCFAYQGNLNSFGLTLDGRSQQEEYLYKHHPGLQTSIRLVVENGQYKAKIDYPAHKYSTEMIHGMMDSFCNIIAEMCQKDSLSDIEICNAEQIAQLDSFNNPVSLTDEEQNATVLSMVRNMAEQYPDNTAVVFKDKRISYKELDELTDKIASAIGSKIQIPGSKCEPVVSIIIHRNEWMVLASLAALKAGCAYQPLDPSYPQDRLNFMVKDADAALLIADPELRDIVNEYEGEVILTSELTNLPNEPIVLKTPPLGAGGLLTLLYTSGSTGVPKGVMLEHQNLVAFNKFFKKYFDITPDSKIAAYASFGFDANMMDIYCTLMNGATLHIIDDEIRLDLEALHQYFEREGITNCFMTTQVGVQFLENYPQSASLKHLSMGGEKLRAVKPEELSYKIHNGYGPSETTCGCTFFPVAHWEPNIPIGKHTDTVSLYVMDKNQHRLPVGAAGELVIVGPQVGRGYLNRPDKTAEAFFTINGQRAYHSGDIVRYREDGNIEFVGRKDGQVKIRGFRIELKEVEAVIRDFPGVKDVTVQAFDDPNGGKFIAAYVVSSDTSLDTDALNAFILDQKPPYMVPAVTMQIEKIPLNVNQKVDKKALLAPSQPSRGKEPTTSAPLNALEKELYNIVAGVVNVSPLGESEGAAFGITDILGYVGLTSISGIKLATLIYKKYGVQVNAKTLAKTGTLQSIENEILQHWMRGDTADTAQQTEVSTISSPRGGREGAAPLSYSQMGVYTECMSALDSMVYNLPLAVSFPAGITVEQLTSAVKTVVGAHPYINLHFQENENGETIQCPIKDYTLEIPVREMTAEEYERTKQNFVRPFNLHEGPLYRFEIVVTESLNSPLSTLHLSCDFHHLIFDGGSVDTFLNQLCKALDGEKIEDESYDYYQFVKDQHIAPATEQFFAEQLGQIEEASALIPDIFTPNLPHSNGSVSIPTDFKAVDEHCKELSVSTASAYLAATFMAVSKFVAEDTVGICTISNGRSNLRIAENFGMFVNTLPLVSKVDASMKTAEFIKQTAALFAETIEHEEYPFARIASQFGFAANILFAYQVGVIADYFTQQGSLKIDNSLELDLARFPVAVNINNTADQGAEIKVEYDKSMFSDAMMYHFGKAIENAVQGLLSAQTIEEISITDESDWKVLDSYNAKEGFAAYNPKPTDTVLSAFQQMAKQYPDHVAAVFKDKRYTYQELDALSDQIGALIYSKLKTQNPEPVVSILINRNQWMFILPLAAMKAGCAYQPLDPSYPQERLNFMVKDADAALLIADPELAPLLSPEGEDGYNGAILLTSEIEEYLKQPSVSTPLAPSGERGREKGAAGLEASSLLILLYTSGSTGVPKGVMLEHRNLIAFNKFFKRYYDVTPESKIAAYASFGFDANMQDVFCSLMNGATLHVIDDDIRFDLEALHQYFEREGITHSFMTTQVAVQYLENYPKSASLKHLSMGGEKLRAVKPEELSYKIHNGYGPSETTCGCAFFHVEHWEPNIPIGTPTDTVCLYIVDKNGHRLPAGAAGELIIVGPQVGRGYLNRPDKTAEAFFKLKNENGKLIIDADGQRAYHSGDIVRYRQDGNIEFVGRKDGQVKIRGFRIELKEVEAVIRDFEGIKNVTVQAYDYEDGGKYIAAFIVSDKSIDINALNEFIKSQKPPYMVPAVTMQIAEIPLNVNQKVDKKALPKPEMAKAEYIAPKNEIEKAFCEIFEKVLGLKQVSATDDFFEIGGSSIIALKLVVAANKAGYDIVYNDVFDNTTPQMLAEFISEKSGSPVETSSVLEESAPLAEDNTRTYLGEDGFDYRPLNALLKQNTLEAFRNGERQQIGDVLLTGATGFLGIHMLYDLITNYEGKIYCLVRPRGPVSGEKRLKAQLFYYFDQNFNALFGKRIFVIEGDATSEKDMRSMDCKADTVVNCAACVKHFAKGNEIENMNVGSVRNLIGWCVEHDARLVHVSTGSVAGMSVNSFPPADTTLTEQMFYFGQDLGNQYVHSKFMAERLILDAILHHGLRAKIMRVGNLSARNVDGEFQINFRSNNFMSTLHTFQFMGVVPYAMQNNPTEFSPIDDTAHTILLLAQSPKECIVCHPCNVHKVLFGDVMLELSNYGNPIRMVENEEFGAIMQQLMEQPENIEKLRSLMAYNNDSKNTSVMLAYDSSYTSQLLYRMGYRWPITTWDYVQRFIKAVGGMGMFESKND